MKIANVRVMESWNDPKGRHFTYLIQGTVSIGYNEGVPREKIFEKIVQTLMHDPRRVEAFPIFGGHS